MNRLRACCGTRTILLAAVAALLIPAAGCVPAGGAAAEEDPNSIVVLQLHVNGNQMWVVNFWVEPGYSSTRTQMGDIRIVVYSTGNKILEDFMIADPRKGIPHEKFDKQVVESFEDDIDFFVVFPAWNELGKVEVYDKNKELLITLDISEAYFKTPGALNPP